jgi:radical SAM protein with 4Fe4S-binding SPASM domain
MSHMALNYSFARFRQDMFLRAFCVLSEHGKATPPHSVVWDSTRKCNLSCIHCAARDTYERELTSAEAKALIDTLSDMKVSSFQVTGGEPLMRKDMLEILSYAAEKGLKTSLATNGFLVDEKMADAIVETGVSLVQVSIDGTERAHNHIRNDDQSFEKAVSAVRCLKESSCPQVSVASTVMPSNLESLNDLKGILIDLGVDFWNIGTVLPAGKARDKPELFLTKEQFRLLLDHIVSSKEDIEIDLGENFPFLGEYEEIIRKRPLICPAGILSCCVGVDGHVRGCPDQQDSEKNREGSILEDGFRDIWAKGFTRYRRREILKTDARCSACASRNACFGGCHVMRESGLHCIKDFL